MFAIILHWIVSIAPIGNDYTSPRLQNPTKKPALTKNSLIRYRHPGRGPGMTQKNKTPINRGFISQTALVNHPFGFSGAPLDAFGFHQFYFDMDID
jgi:hypothetical protein